MFKNDRRYLEAGRHVAKLRRKAGLSQYDLSRRLGLKRYTFISQIETGRARVPSRTMKDWALALETPPAEFAKALLRSYDRKLFNLLFPEKPPRAD